jgi:hypothetical protein
VGGCTAKRPRKGDKKHQVETDNRLPVYNRKCTNTTEGIAHHHALLFHLAKPPHISLDTNLPESVKSQQQMHGKDDSKMVSVKHIHPEPGTLQLFTRDGTGSHRLHVNDGLILFPLNASPLACKLATCAQPLLHVATQHISLLLALHPTLKDYPRMLS